MGFQALSMRVAVVMALSIAAAVPVLGQAAATGKSDPLTVKKLDAGWEEIDSRMVFLTMQLSSVEASLAAVNKAILLTGFKKETQKIASDQYDRGNEMMDRKGGGPVAWNEFYGRTAEKFFYHPQENEISLSIRVLKQQGETIDKPGDVARQQTELSNRPPQFDYIYRANVQAKAKAEADIAALGNKVETLLTRRRQLENEQSTLWAQIVTRSVVCRSLNEKPWYRLELTTSDGSAEANEKLKAAKAAAKLIRTHLAVLEKAEDSKRLNEAVVYGDLEKVAAAARLEFADVIYMQRTLQQDMGDVQKPIGRFFALSKRAGDQTKNINDAYQVAMESDKVGDDLRKGTSRGLLQSSLVNYAETILALDEVFGVMIREWNIEAAPGKQAEKIDLKLSDYSKAAPTSATASEEKIVAVRENTKESDPKPRAIGPVPTGLGTIDFFYSRLRAGATDQLVVNGKAIDPIDLSATYATELMKRGWYSRAAEVCREAGQQLSLSQEDQKEFKAMRSRAMLLSASAWIALGNIPRADKALEACEAIKDDGMDENELTRLQTLFKQMDGSRSLKSLKSDEPLKGDVKWTDEGGGVTFVGGVQVGNGKGNHPNLWKDIRCDLDVLPGFYGEGGVITASMGTIRFQGKPDKPIVLKNVRIDCELDCVVKANNTIFINCTFNRVGSWSWPSYNAKWEFMDCIIQQCNWPNLSWYHHGLKANNSIFVNMKIPDREWAFKKEDLDKPLKYTYDYEWNDVNDCDFWNCDFAVNTLWITRRCNFYINRAIGEGAYGSKFDKIIILGLLDEEKFFLDDVKSRSKTTSRGILTLKSQRPFTRRAPSTLWRWADGTI